MREESMKAKEVESFSFRKEKPAGEEGERADYRTKVFVGLVKESRERGIVYRENYWFSGAGNNGGREQHLAGLSFRSIDEVRLASF